MNEKYLKILATLQRAIKKDTYAEIESISTEDLIGAKINLSRESGTPPYSLLLEVIKNRENKVISVNKNRCGVLAKDSCDMGNEISQNYAANNVFLDIPYLNYDDCEDILRNVLASVGLNPVVAKGKVTSQVMLCKICKLIKTSQYGISDISSGSNSVSYEYGLMHGFGMNVALLMRENTDKFSDITGIDHLEYDDLHSFKLIIAKWLLENVPEANKENLEKIISEETELRKKNINPYKNIRTIADEPTTVSGHIETPATDKAATYFKIGAILAKRQVNGKEFLVAYQSAPLLYLRLIPTAYVAPLKQKEIKDIVFGIKIDPLRRNFGDGASWELNQYGGLTYSFEGGSDGHNYFTTSQVFQNREIWGIDSSLLAGRKSIPSVAFEQLYESALRQYLEVAINLLNLKPPFIVEAGASDIKDFTMAMGETYIERYWGPIYQNEIKSRHTLQSAQDIDSILLAIFDDFFDAVGESRPENFRGFPSNNVKSTSPKH